MSTLIMQECNRTLVQAYRLPPTKITCPPKFVCFLFGLSSPSLNALIFSTNNFKEWSLPSTAKQFFFCTTPTRFIFKNNKLQSQVGSRGSLHVLSSRSMQREKKKNSLAWGRNSWNVRNLYDTCLLVLLPLSKKLDHSSQMCSVELRTYPITFLESRSMRIVIRFKIWIPFWRCSS